MSSLGEDESLGSGFYEESICRNECLMAEYSELEPFSSIESIRPKWKKVPRSPSDFIEPISESSSCKDSDYEAWLENYYKKEYEDTRKLIFLDEAVDTSDLLQEEEKLRICFSPYQPKFKSKWSYSTKYWGPKDARRHWAFERKKDDVFFFPSIHPILNLRSRYGRFRSQLNSAAAVPEITYGKLMCSTFKKVIEQAEVSGPQLLKMMLCDNLCYFKWFDSMTKEKATRTLCKFLRRQIYINDVCMENADLTRQEGIVFLCALSQQAGCEIKELHMWKMFAHGESPTLLKELNQRGKLVPAKQTTKYLVNIHFLQILRQFRNLTSLSVNYAYIANKHGNALLCLQSIRTGIMKDLRILCLEDERPLVTNPGHGVGGFKIPDGVWKRVAEWNPDMNVHFVFVDIPQYENVILFLSKSIPMTHVYLSSGIDLDFRTPWDVDSILLELRNWYSKTLKDLSLHFWHHRDLLDFVIRKKILIEFPNLINFEFIGVLEDVETIEEFCCELSRGTYKIRTLLLWMQEQHTNRKKCLRSKKRVAEIREKYSRKFDSLDIDADIRTYEI